MFINSRSPPREGLAVGGQGHGVILPSLQAADLSLILRERNIRPLLDALDAIIFGFHHIVVGGEAA